MKELYNILEKEKDVSSEIEDIDVTDEEVIQYFKENPDELKKIIKSIKDADIDDEKKKKLLKSLAKDAENVSESLILEKRGYGRAFLLGGIPGVIANGVIRGAKKHSVNKQVNNLKSRYENESDPEKKEQYKQEYENYKKAAYDKDGKVIVREKNIKKRIEQLQKDKEISGDFSVDTMKDIKLSAQEYAKKQKQSKKEEPEEETVKDKSGVEWIKRKKERGEGYTYCKKDDRSVTMSQDEYNKRNASKSKNESQYSSLKDYLIESIQ